MTKRETRPPREQPKVVSVRKPMKYFNSFVTPKHRITWVKITIVATLLCCFGLSWRLWVSSRLFPLSPVSSVLPVVLFPFDYIWLFLLLGILVGIAIIAQPRKLILYFLVFAGLLSLWDQMRWQPWFYQCFFMLAAIGFYAWKQPEAENQHVTLNACRLIVVLTYLWSGLQKLNANFVRDTWPDLAGPLLRLLPILKKLPPWLILIIPVVEILLGFGLLTRKFRNLTVLFAFATHVFVLTLLIWSGENVVVWPWNIAMALFVVILFWQNNETSARNIVAGRNLFQPILLLLFGVMPAFSLFNLWDSYLSAALYSGNTDRAVVLVSPDVISHLPAEIHAHIWQNSKPFFLDLNRWSYGELNVPAYPEPRVYRRVAERICRYADNSSDIKLRIFGKPNLLTGVRKSEFYDCDHLDLDP
jgi:hypothetical protein